MSKRKVVKQGPSTLMISLPANWVKKNNLSKGDEIDLVEENNSLIVNSTKVISKEKHVIDISGLTPLVNRILMSMYIRGVNELEVKFSEQSEVKDFQKRVINELIGFEIVKQSQNSFVIKDITGAASQQIDEIIKRIFLILDSMIDELIISLENKQDTSPVIETDMSVNKFCNFCLRILNEKGYRKYENTSQVYGIVSQLEEIGDILKKIAIESKKYHLDKDQIKILKEIKEFLKMFEELFFKFEKKEAVLFAKKYEEIKKKTKNKNIIDLYLLNIIETIIKMNNYLLVAFA